MTATPQRTQKTACRLDIGYSSITDAIKELIRERKRLTRDGWTDLAIDMQTEDYSHSEKEYPFIVGKRMETQEEAEAREARDAKWARDREERDRADFERLKAKFQ